MAAVNAGRGGVVYTSVWPPSMRRNMARRPLKNQRAPLWTAARLVAGIHALRERKSPDRDLHRAGREIRPELIRRKRLPPLRAGGVRSQSCRNGGVRNCGRLASAGDQDLAAIGPQPGTAIVLGLSGMRVATFAPADLLVEREGPRLAGQRVVARGARSDQNLPSQRWTA